MVPVSRAVGRKRAMQMLLTGETIDAATALDWGLVNRVVPAAELDAAVAELVEAIARSSSYTVAVGKRAFYDQVDRAEHDAYEHDEDRDDRERARRRRPGGDERVPPEARPRLDR